VPAKPETKTCALCMKVFLDGYEGSLKWSTEALQLPSLQESEKGHSLLDVAEWDLDFCSIKCLKIWVTLQLEKEKLQVLKQISAKLDNLLTKT
jgi:hypothetical protein